MTIIRTLIVAALLAFSGGTAIAEDLTDVDKAQIETIIRSQIDAFQRDDGTEAYSYASPGIQTMFQNPDIFMRMVRQGYQPVYRPRRVDFLSVSEAGGRIVQSVAIVGPDGGNWIAMYPMERQPDGTWRIAGCQLVKEPGESA